MPEVIPRTEPATQPAKPATGMPPAMAALAKFFTQ